MKLSQWLNEERGRGLGLATAIGVSPVLISQWSTGLRIPPFERCIPIERATGGVVTRRDLRPDDFASMWPELAQPSIPNALATSCARANSRTDIAPAAAAHVLGGV